MIEGLKGVAALKELAAIAQNLEKKLGLPVSVEVLQKMMETKDGYKYLANIDGKPTEILSKKELETGVKYWADGVKNQMSNTLTLENLVQKPYILQSEVFKSDTLSKALGFEKLVEVVKAQMAKIVSSLQKTADVATTQPEANNNTASAIRLAAAEVELSRPIAQTIQTTQTITKPKYSSDQKEIPKSEPQKMQAQEAATVKSEVAATKETVLKELKAVVSASSPTIAIQSTKDGPKATKSELQESTQKSEASKDTQKEVAPQRASEKLSGETLRDKLREFKNIMASLPTVPSKAEMEKAKTESYLYQREAKSASQESVFEAVKIENIEKLLAVLAKNFEGATKNLLEESAKKIADLIFGKLPESEADEAILKVLEHLKKQLNEKAIKSAEKKASPVAAEVGEEVSAKAQDAEQSESAVSKTDNPASKLKMQLLEEIAKVATKNDFQILSQVAMALNKEVFTFVLKDKGVLQFKKKRQKELNAKTVEFYSAFETLGPISGEISHVDGETTLSLNVEFESTYNFLKENLKDLSFFDHKNVSIMHGIKEIVEIRSSFLDTTG
jgi:hypothetical protein